MHHLLITLLPIGHAHAWKPLVQKGWLQDAGTGPHPVSQLFTAHHEHARKRRGGDLNGNSQRFHRAHRHLQTQQYGRAPVACLSVVEQRDLHGSTQCLMPPADMPLHYQECTAILGGMLTGSVCAAVHSH